MNKADFANSDARRGPGGSGLRQVSDAQLHDQAQPPGAPSAEHPSVFAGEPTLVTDQPTLEPVVERLRSAGEFAFDSEFIGERTFHARFCVLQAATPEDLVLVDALAEVDLTPMWALLGEPKVRKLVHAGRQDLEPVVRLFNQPPRNIFDVQLASGFIGLGYPLSLDRLLETLAGIEVGSGAKFSQWDRRPLTDMQRRYAADDVRYLPLLAQKIEQRLDELGNRAWAEAEMANLEDAELYRFDPQSQKLRAKGLTDLDARQWSVLTALIDWRGRQAEADDVPPRALVPDEALASLARSGPGGEPELAKVKFLPRPVRQRFGRQLLEVIEAGQTPPLAKVPHRPPRLTQAQKTRVDKLWQAVRQCCADRRIDSGLVLAKRELVKYVRETTAIDSPPPRTRLVRGWRGELLEDVLD